MGAEPRVRYFREEGQAGIIILESPAQSRTIFSDESPLYVKFQNLIHIVRYCVTETGEFTYLGAYVNGLVTCMSEKPLASFQDPVLFCGTDSDKKGLSCTPHDFDEMVCPSRQELAQAVLQVWWNTSHYFDGINHGRPCGKSLYSLVCWNGAREILGHSIPPQFAPYSSIGLSSNPRLVNQPLSFLDRGAKERGKEER